LTTGAGRCACGVSLEQPAASAMTQPKAVIRWEAGDLVIVVSRLAGIAAAARYPLPAARSSRHCSRLRCLWTDLDLQSPREPANRARRANRNRVENIRFHRAPQHNPANLGAAFRSSEESPRDTARPSRSDPLWAEPRCGGSARSRLRLESCRL